MDTKSKVLLSGSFVDREREDSLIMMFKLCSDSYAHSISYVGIKDGVYTIEDQFSRERSWARAKKRIESVNDDFFYTAS
jgi:hypothetical protein